MSNQDERAARVFENGMGAHYTGHLPDGSGIQAHSAGPDFPGIIYGKEFEGDPHTYWGVLFDGFDYGVFRTHSDAQALIRLIKSVRLGNAYRAKAERELAVFLDRLAARAGLTPVSQIRDNEKTARNADRYAERDGMPVDNLRSPIVARMRWGYTPQCDRFLEAWGYNPTDFQAHGTRLDPCTARHQTFGGKCLSCGHVDILPSRLF